MVADREQATEDTFDSAAVKASVLDRVGSEARWYKYRLPILIGSLGGLALFALYLMIVTVAQGWQHAVELFGQDAWLVIPIMTGFGVQAGLYTYLRGVLRRGSRRSKVMMGAGGGTSTAAMVACCAHHVADVLPLLGLSAAAWNFRTFTAGSQRFTSWPPNWTKRWRGLNGHWYWASA